MIEMMFVILAFIFLIIGFLGSVVPILPGPPIGYVGLLFLQKSGRSDFSPTFMLILAAAVIIVTVMDFFLPAIFTKKFGGSRTAVTGSVIGTIAGFFVLPPLGILLGPFVGAFIGETMYNNKMEKMENDAKQADAKAAAATVVSPPCETETENVKNVIVPDSVRSVGSVSTAAFAIAPVKSSPIYVALGAFLAFLAGTGAKLLVGGFMIFIAVRAMIG